MGTITKKKIFLLKLYKPIQQKNITTMETGRLDWNTERLTRAHVAEMEKFNKFDQTKVSKHYDEVAANYEGIYLRAGYPDPKKVQEVVQEVAHR